MIAASEKPVIVYKDGTELTQLKVLADLINAKLICFKGNANSLGAAQLQLDKPLQLSGKQTIYVVAGDEELSQKMIKEIEKVPFKVVQSTYSSSLTGIADVVLPSTSWLEQEGHYLNSEGFMQLANKSITPAEDILTPFATLGLVAEKLGIKLADGWEQEVHKRTAPVELVR